MENLITCSRVLYDKDISDKMKEITSLKKNLLSYEKPKVEYVNLEEYKTKKRDAYQIIKKGLDKLIIDDFKYHHMSCEGLIFFLSDDLPSIIKESLDLITKKKNKEWVEKISYDIVYGIEGFLNGFKKTGVWNLLDLDPETMSNLLYNNIIWQLDDTHYPCILEEIAIFTCKICGKKNDYVNDDNICINCEEQQNE